MAVDVAGSPTSTTAARGEPPPTQAFERFVLAALLVLAVVGIYAQVVGFQFLTWDDDIHLTKNPYFNPLTWGGLGRFWEASYENLYIPVSYTCFAAEAWLSEQVYGELNAAIFHAGNVILHLACVLLVFRLLARLVENRLAAWAGALWFAVHPLQVESVAWISETRGLLSAMFSLAALLWYLPKRSPTLSSGASRNVAATICFVLAVLSKPSAVTLPLIGITLEWLCFQHSLKHSLLRSLPWLAIGLAVVVVTKNQQADARIAVQTSLLERPIIAADAVAFYLGKLAVPLKLCFDYGLPPRKLLAGGVAPYAWLLPIAVLVLISAGRNRRWGWAAAGVFVAALLPALGFVPFLFQDTSMVADRYAYFAMLGISLGLAAWLDRHWSRSALVVTCLLLGALGRAAWLQAGYWRDDLALFTHGLEVNPASYTAEFMLGTVDQLDGRPNDALTHYRAALRIDPKYARAHNDLAVTLYMQGRIDQAMEHFRKALELKPDYCEAHIGLGNALAARKKWREAVREYEAALEINPQSAQAEVNWGDVLLEQGKSYDAILHLRQAIELRPRMAEAHFKFAEASYRVGDLRRAEAEFRAALDCRPKFSEAHLNLGSIHMAHGEVKEALAEYETALRLDPQLVNAHIMKADALMQQGRFDAALAELRTARDMVPPDSEAANLVNRAIKRAEPE